MEDMHELFRRMVFNILIDNTDDHEKNDEAVSEARGVAQVVSGWREHFAASGVAPGDIELYAEQIDRPFLREQREEAEGR